jgi:flagellar biosynthesis GTPase FlhF
MVSEQSTESSDPMEITQYMNMVSTSFGKQMLALNLVANKLAIFRHKKLSWKEHPLVLFFIGPTGVG